MASFVGVSNYIKIIGKEYIRFHPPRGLQKYLIKDKYIVIGKVIFSRRNYCKKKITEDSIQ